MASTSALDEFTNGQSTTNQYYIRGQYYNTIGGATEQQWEQLYKRRIPIEHAFLLAPGKSLGGVLAFNLSKFSLVWTLSKPNEEAQYPDKEALESNFPISRLELTPGTGTHVNIGFTSELFTINAYREDNQGIKVCITDLGTEYGSLKNQTIRVEESLISGLRLKKSKTDKNEGYCIIYNDSTYNLECIVTRNNSLFGEQNNDEEDTDEEPDLGSPPIAASLVKPKNELRFKVPEQIFYSEAEQTQIDTTIPPNPYFNITNNIPGISSYAFYTDTRLKVEKGDQIIFFNSNDGKSIVARKYLQGDVYYVTDTIVRNQTNVG